MTHSRLTQAGQAIGRSTARLAEMGRARLQAKGLDQAAAPALRQEMCKTCACQRGSVQNGCLQTQLDFLKAAAEGKRFLCHSPRDGRLCVGWVRVRAEIVANPLPKEILEMVEKWEYSPPDEPEVSE